MELIVKILKGDNPYTTSCHFCSVTEDIRSFGILSKRKAQDDHIFQFVGVCPFHLKGIEHILSGAIDFDRYCSKTDNTITDDIFNLRS